MFSWLPAQSHPNSTHHIHCPTFEPAPAGSAHDLLSAWWRQRQRGSVAWRCAVWLQSSEVHQPKDHPILGDILPVATVSVEGNLWRKLTVVKTNLHFWTYWSESTGWSQISLYRVISSAIIKEDRGYDREIGSKCVLPECSNLFAWRCFCIKVQASSQTPTWIMW